MTPEEIAKQLVDKWFNYDAYDLFDSSETMCAELATAIRDAYERAARRVYRGGNPDWVAADILRMRDGLPLDAIGSDTDGYEHRLAELMGE